MRWMRRVWEAFCCVPTDRPNPVHLAGMRLFPVASADYDGRASRASLMM